MVHQSALFLAFIRCSDSGSLMPNSRRGVVLDNDLVHVTPNSALLTDTYTSPLRAQRGAAKRER